MAKKDWKQMILASGIPLEYEVSKKLLYRNENCELQTEFSYQRKHLGELKEFSIDIITRYPFEPKNIEGDVTLNLLIECKYRAKDKDWLFLPYLGEGIGKDFSLPISNISIHDIDHPGILNVISSHFKTIPQGYKGIEFHKYTNQIIEKNVIGGIHQLQYAFPNYVYSNLQYFYDFLDDFLEDELFPLSTDITCPILITTAPLKVFNENLSLESISEADNIDELCNEVSYLVYNIPDSLEYDSYKEKLFKLHYGKIKKQADRHQNSDDEDFGIDPLSKYARDVMHQSIIVCNFNHFDKLIDDLMKIGTDIAELKYKAYEHFTYTE